MAYRSLTIPNMKSDFANSKWQILYGGRKILNLVKRVWFLYLLNFNKKHILFQVICTKHIMKHPPLLIHGLGTGGGRVSFLFSVFCFFSTNLFMCNYIFQNCDLIFVSKCYWEKDFLDTGSLPS